VLFLTWLVVIVSFFILAVQLFVTLIEFKLTTLAGFLLVPFALWNRTAFLAERVLGNVVSAGVKVLVLAVIVGIGSVVFADFRNAVAPEPSVDNALALMLASLTLLGLGIFGPGIATASFPVARNWVPVRRWVPRLARPDSPQQVLPRLWALRAGAVAALLLCARRHRFELLREMALQTSAADRSLEVQAALQAPQRTPADQLQARRW